MKEKSDGVSITKLSAAFPLGSGEEGSGGSERPTGTSRAFPGFLCGLPMAARGGGRFFRGLAPLLCPELSRPS